MRARLAALALTLWPVWAGAQMPSADLIGPGAVAAIPEIAAFRDWQVICTPTICQAEPRMQGSPDLSVSVIRDETGPVMIVRAPLGLLLGEGIDVAVDGRSLGRLAFLTCEPGGCVAPVRLDGPMSRPMRGGAEMTMTLKRRDGTVVEGRYSLLGFIAALDSLETQQSGRTAAP